MAQHHQDATYNDLAHRIGEFISKGVEQEPGEFNELALQLFNYQIEANSPFKLYCAGKNVYPNDVSDWRDIPAYPTDAFKQGIITSFPSERAVFAQLTSGTTANQRGQIFRDSLGKELVFSANRIMTEAYLFPDYAFGQPKCRILILAPSPKMAPSMGMAVGMEQTRIHFGSPDSAFLLNKSGIDIPGLVLALENSEKSGEPVALIGSTSAFVFLFNACRNRKIRFCLPPGSRIADGGGYRGRFGEMTREEYFQLADDILGIPRSHCINVLGMAESATNYFENSLREFVYGRINSPVRRMDPPWTKTLALNCETLAPLPPGEIGLLCHYDLANLPTVIGVQTDNLGYLHPMGGFQIIGRAKVSEKGVSTLPSERVVGPMGDKRIFRFLESYVNFSIRFKMGLITGNRRPETHYPPPCPCTAVADEMIDETPD